MRKLAVVGVLVGLLTAPGARAVSLADTGVFTGISNYLVWRGYNLNRTSSLNHLGATFRLSDRLTATPSIWNFTGLDTPMDSIRTDYSASLHWVPPVFNDKLTLTAGYIYYDVQLAAYGADSQEAYFGLNVDTPLSPALYVYQDFDKAVGTYLDASIGHSWELGQSGWTLGLSGNLGWDIGRFDGFSHAVIHTSLNTDLGGGLSFGPAFDWWFPSNNTDPAANGSRPVFSLGFSWARAW